MGVFILDHKDSPGITEAEMRLAGIHHPGIQAGSILEFDTKTCGHCGSPVALNPKRKRDRGNCSSCGYICDSCAVTYYADGTCRNRFKVADLALERTISISI